MTLIDGRTRQEFGCVTPAFSAAATVHVHSPRLYRRAAFGGHIAIARSYADGDWSCDNLPALIQIFVRHMDVADATDSGWARLAMPLHRAYHWFRQNTRIGSRKNISAHYDLGNEFFAQFLDETMTYSAGIFETPASTMHEASIAKLDRICRKLDLRPTDRVLEIGTGWGSFAIHAASRYGCHVTTTTISEEQHKIAVQRVADAGLADRIDVLLSDYRALTGRYDKLVSIEMIEAVGHEYLDTFLRKCCNLLTPEGLFAIQAITIPDHRYDAARKTVDFIKREIFPGCCIPSIERISRGVASGTDFKMTHLEDITPHYARTLAEWRSTMHANMDAIRAMGYSERFIRLWDFYLSYCEGGFEDRYIGTIQMLLARPRNRRQPIMAALDVRE